MQTHMSRHDTVASSALTFLASMLTSSFDLQVHYTGATGTAVEAVGAMGTVVEATVFCASAEVTRVLHMWH